MQAKCQFDSSVSPENQLQMKKIVLVLSAFLLFLSTGCDFFESKKLFSNDVDTLQTYLRKKDSLDSLKQIQEAKKQAKLAEQARRDSIKAAAEKHRREYKFHIVVGSFKTPKYASAYHTFIKGKGYETKPLKNKYGFELVSIGAYRSWNEAVRDLNKTREELLETAWIYIDEYEN